MACRITRTVAGKIDEVLTPQGNSSQLYQEIIKHLKAFPNDKLNMTDHPYIKKALREGKIRDYSTPELALGIWSMVYTESFKKEYGDWELVTGEIDSLTEPSIIEPEVQKYLFSYNENVKKAEPEKINTEHQEIVNKLTDSFVRVGVNVEVEVDTTISDSGQVLPHEEGGKFRIKINPNLMVDSSIFHEFAHIYVNLLGWDHSLVQEGIKQLKDTELWNRVAAQYPDYNQERLGKEVLVTAIGMEGAKLQYKKPTKLQSWINRFFRAVGKILGLSPSVASSLAKDMWFNNINKTGLTDKTINDLERQRVSENTKDLIDKIKVSLKNNIQIYTMKGQEKQTETLKKIYKETFEKLDDTKHIEALIDYTESIGSQIHSIRRALDKIKSYNEKDQSKFIAELVDMLQYTKSFDYIREIRSVIRDQINNNTLPTDVMITQELANVIDMMDSIEQDVAKLLPNVLTDWLLIHSSKEEISQYVGRVTEKMKAEKRLIDLNKKDPEYKKLENELEAGNITQKQFHEQSVDLNIQQFKDNLIPNKAMLRELLQRQLKDKSGYSMWVDPLIYSNDISLQQFAKAVKAALYRGNEKSIKTQKRLEKAYARFKRHKGSDTNVAKFNEGLYETIKVKIWDEETNTYVLRERASFVQPYDISSFHTKEVKMLNTLGKKYNKPKVPFGHEDFYKWIKTEDARQYEKEEAEWYRLNTQPINDAQKLIKENETNISNLLQRRTQIQNARIKLAAQPSTPEVRDQLRTLENALQDIAAKLSVFNEWKNGNYRVESGEKGIYTPKGDLIRPNDKYKNSKYDALTKKKEDFRYYNELLSIYNESQDGVNTWRLRHKINKWDSHSYILPSVRKTDWDRISEQGATKGAKDALKEGFNVVSTDTQFGHLTQDNEVYKAIPVYYISDEKPGDVSLNLAESVLQFAHMSHLYEEKHAIQQHVLAMQNLIGNREVQATNSKGDIIWNKLAQGMGIEMSKNLDPKMSKNYRHLQSFIEMNFYGMSQELFIVPTMGQDVSLNKASGMLIQYTAMDALAFNLLQATNQVMMDNLSGFAEGVAGHFHTKKQWLDAKSSYWRHGAAISDMTRMQPQTTLGMLIDLYDPIQGNFTDEFGKKITGNEFKKRLKSDALFFMQKGAEHELNVTRMIAIMMNTAPKKANGKYVTKEGKETENKEEAMNLFEAYEKAVKEEDGTFTLPHDLEFGEKERMDLRNIVHGLNKYTNGVYNSFDKGMFKTKWWGGFFGLFRGWMNPGIRKKYGRKGTQFGVHTDEEMGIIGEGTYVSTMRWLRDSFRAKTAPWNYKEKLTPMERENVARTMVDIWGIMATIVLSALVTGALGAGEDDEDQNYGEAFLLYQLRRLRMELTAYVNPKEALRLIESPAPTSRSVVDTIDTIWSFLDLSTMGSLGYAVNGELPDRFKYQRRTGKYEKGDLKLWKKINKIIPVFNGIQKSSTPDQALKWFNK